MSSKKQVEFLVKLRDAVLMLADAANEYLENFAPKDEKQQSTVNEAVFSVLTFEPQTGFKLGNFEIAFKNNNSDKWTSAYELLNKANASIKDRYHGQNYVFSYWIFGEGKIYRQKLKQTGATQ